MLRERITAVRATISDIIGGDFREDTGPHVVSPFGVELRRVVVVGFVVNKFYREGDDSSKRFESITLDDGTDTIRIKVWGDEDSAVLEGVKENILALVIGKVRHYEEETYIIPEIVRELTDPNYMSLHLMERYKAILTRSGISLPSTVEEGQELLVSTPTAPVAPVTGKLAKDIVSYIQLEATDEGMPLKDIVVYFKDKGKDPDKVQTKVWELAAEGHIIERPIGHFRTPDY
ncbi:MAG: OB-fold nucleic acid binding domain-containing protein [Candidatus Thorarchaeota archaeon]